ncbi:MAG: type III-B CRISPR module RAMP protein Cmr1 [Leptolyngbyaceae bacterium]|nr:type III-B CRISPR module RAMP protein Cmr1 [Leptolyngbyaceae bacterium]
MTPRQNHRNASKRQNPTDAWHIFIQAQLKQGSKVGKAYEKAGFAGFDNKVLTLYFEDESLSKKARGQMEPLKKKLPPELQPCDRIEFQIGKVPTVSSESSPSSGSGRRQNPKVSNPLQALNYADDRENELSQPVLVAAVQAEKNCSSIYSKLRQRTESLAGGEENIIPVSFNWRLRVGGTRGFRELLLPVFHPVFGVPYIPSSSLKGAARAWARHNGESKSKISRILGFLDGKVAQAAKVEFLDAFPTKECLSVDVATPQWHWQNNTVAYKPEPHPLLSMERPQFLIGLRPSKPENAQYVTVVKEWLENALKSGIGSRVSSGYGRALGQPSSTPLHAQRYGFELWTQGMYGADQKYAELRPTAIRGVLRYWFRAVALSLYEPSACQDLEDKIFGKLSQQGKITISVTYNTNNPSTQFDPYRYDGNIYLEGVEKKYLKLLSKLLVLASHLGGIGRGSRRPLHLLDVEGRKYMRGCHWTVDAEAIPLEYNSKVWKQLFSEVEAAFTAIQSPTISRNSDPGSPGQGKRQQDVLDANAQVWLIRSPNQVSPDKVSSWREEGLNDDVRGTALSLFYSDDRFKGKNKKGQGNPYVGGAFGTPSFVWITSVFPSPGEPYQVVTIFGVDHPDRLLFAQELDKLAKANPSKAKLVFGQMPTGNRPKPNPPRGRRR